MGQSCLWVNSKPLSWFEAEAECAKTARGHLASCLNDDEMKFLASDAGIKGTDTWIGISDL